MSIEVSATLLDIQLSTGQNGQAKGHLLAGRLHGTPKLQSGVSVEMLKGICHLFNGKMQACTQPLESADYSTRQYIGPTIR